MKQNKEILNIEELKENLMYEYFSSLSSDELEKALEEIKNSDEDFVKDPNFISMLYRVTRKLEDERLREIFYWRLYYLLDEEDKFTKLGEYYSLIYTHHYLKALKLFFTFSETLREKNNVFTKNEKATEYLNHFREYVKKENKIKIKRRR